jgi:hypothetical protein
MKSMRWSCWLLLGLVLFAGAAGAAEPSLPGAGEEAFLAELATETVAPAEGEEAIAAALPAPELRAECTEGATTLLWNGCCSPQLDRYTPFVCQGGVWVRQTSYCQPVLRFRCTFS